MNEKQESPWTVCRPSKGSKLRKTTQYIIALFTQGQAEKLAFILALRPYEMIPAAIIVAFAMGAS